MRGIPGVAVLAAAALLFTFAGAADASDTHPDCEAGQRDHADGAPVQACEGEHWDGQDPYAQDAGLVVRHGSPGAPTAAHPVALGVHVDGSGVFVFGTLYGAGELSLWTDAESRTVAAWARDGSDTTFAGTPVESGLVIVDGALGRDNPGADGNVGAWVVGATGTVMHTIGVPWASGTMTGEGDCDQSTYETSDCERDNTALTVVLP